MSLLNSLKILQKSFSYNFIVIAPDKNALTLKTKRIKTQNLDGKWSLNVGSYTLMFVAAIFLNILYVPYMRHVILFIYFIRLIRFLYKLTDTSNTRDYTFLN